MSHVNELRKAIREMIEDELVEGPLKFPFACVTLNQNGVGTVVKKFKSLSLAKAHAEKSDCVVIRLTVDVPVGQTIDASAVKKLREMNTTANVQGYNVPGAFSDDEEDKGTDTRGMNGGRIKTKEGGARSHSAEVFGYTLVENRWLDLKKDDSRNAVQKIGYGLREIKKQLREVENYTRWYKRLRVENDVETDRYWKRTGRDLNKIKSRIVNIAKNIQEISP